MNEYQLSVSQLYSDISDTEFLRRVKIFRIPFPTVDINTAKYNNALTLNYCIRT